MQNVLRRPGGSESSFDEPQHLKAIDLPSSSIRLRLSTDRAPVASRLIELLGAASSIEILTGAASDEAAPGQEPRLRPAVLLLDCAAFAPQERLRLQRTARSHFPARVLWLLDVPPSSSYAVRLVLDAVKAGWCHGYVAADCPFNILVRAVAAVARHDIWLPRAMLVRALSEFRSLRAAVRPPVASVHEKSRTRILFTMRERQILHLVWRGLINKEIGRHLAIKEDTVKKHLRNMYTKLGVHRRAQMLLRIGGEARAAG